MTKYGQLTLAEVEAIVNKLGGMEGVKRFLSGESVAREAEHKFKVWKTIKLGSGLRTAEDFRRALRGGGFRLSDWASDILEKPAFTVATEETELDLVRVTVGELGFRDGARREQIYERAKELGLEFCPLEVGPQLRLQYKGQPNGGWVLVATEPIFGSDGGPFVFRVECDGSELWLDSFWCHPNHFWSADSQWVFGRSRK